MLASSLMADRDDPEYEHGKDKPEEAPLAKIGDVLLPQVVEALRKEGAPVDVNFLLVQVVQKTQSPTEAVENSRQMLELVRELEHERVKNFTNMANAVIDAKLRDPDEVEKRRNNKAAVTLKDLWGFVPLEALRGALRESTLVLA